MLYYDEAYEACRRIEQYLDSYEPSREIVVFYNADDDTLTAVMPEHLRGQNGGPITAETLNRAGLNTHFRRVISGYSLLADCDVQYGNLVEYRSNIHCSTCASDWQRTLKRELR